MCEALNIQSSRASGRCPWVWLLVMALSSPAGLDAKRHVHVKCQPFPFRSACLLRPVNSSTPHLRASEASWSAGASTHAGAVGSFTSSATRVYPSQLLLAPVQRADRAVLEDDAIAMRKVAGVRLLATSAFHRYLW